MSETAQRETITLGGGCFWCIEAVYEQVRGVTGVESGYSNGHVARPTYEQVCSGTTGHAEVVRVTFDPRKISYGQILQIYFSVGHDPTQLNRQGPDHGTQYRSTVFPTSAAQERVAVLIARWLDEPDGGNLWGRGDPEEYVRDNFVGTVEQVTEKVQGFVDAGCRGFVLWFRDFPSSESMERFMSEVAPAVSG